MLRVVSGGMKHVQCVVSLSYTWLASNPLTSKRETLNQCWFNVSCLLGTSDQRGFGSKRWVISPGWTQDSLLEGHSQSLNTHILERHVHPNGVFMLGHRHRQWSNITPFNRWCRIYSSINFLLAH